MKISQLIARLERLKAEQGYIEILREDGKPFSVILIDKIHPITNCWAMDHQESVSE